MGKITPENWNRWVEAVRLDCKDGTYDHKFMVSHGFLTIISPEHLKGEKVNFNPVDGLNVLFSTNTEKLQAGVKFHFGDVSGTEHVIMDVKFIRKMTDYIKISAIWYDGFSQSNII